jgi:hypothetical protein
LPKYEINLDVPNFIIKSDQVLSGTIEVKYTYGKNVEGEALITLEEKNFWLPRPVVEPLPPMGDVIMARGMPIFYRPNTYNKTHIVQVN